MALKNFKGKTFVAFTDISGFKGMMQREKAAKALKNFFSIGYRVLQSNPEVSGVFISDCGILYHSKDNEDPLKRLQDILKVIKEINKKMADLDYVLTTSIAYGDFEYQDKIELHNMTKNAFHGNAYLDAFIDNEYTKPKLKVGECRIVEHNDVNEVLNTLSQNGNYLRKQRNHYYFYWMLKYRQSIEEYEQKIKDIEHQFSRDNKRLLDEKYDKLKRIIKND